MASSSTKRRELHRYACSLCTRRKVKCDKGDPCANCSKVQIQCLYEAPVPYRSRKRAGDEDLLARLALYEDLMRNNNIDFSRYATTWVPSTQESRIKDHEPQSLLSLVPVHSRSDSNTHALEKTADVVEP
jgi:hypothetical protein